jgi:hypothetical protein
VTFAWESIRRAIHLYDTSALTSAAVISAAVESIYGTAKTDGFTCTPDIDVYTSSPASNTALASGDFDSLGATSQTGSPISYASWNTAGYNDFTYNATGIGNISKTSITKMGKRNVNRDVSNSEPGWVTVTASGLSGYYADQTGTANDPKLVVTYLRTDYQNVQGVAVAGGVRSRKVVRAGDVQGVAVAGGVRSRKVVRAGDVQGKLEIGSVRAKGKVTSGTVEAAADSTSVHSRGKSTVGSVESEITSDSAYAYASGSGGTAHPYAGTVGADVELDSDRYKNLVRFGSVEANVTDGTGSVAKSRVRDGSVEAEADATTVHSRSKSYASSIEAETQISSVLSKGKSYPGSLEAEVTAQAERIVARVRAGTVETEVIAQADRIVGRVRDGTIGTNVVASSDRNRAKVYVGSLEAILAPDSIRYKGKVYAGSNATIIEIGGVYSKVTPGANAYVGTVEATVSGSSVVALGKAYQSDANLVVELAGAYAFVHPSTNIYSGDVQSIASVEGSYSKSGKATYQYSGTIYITVDPSSAYSLYSSVIVIPYRVKEAKPHDGYILETLPGIPGSQDGAYTDPLQDGAWTEEPKDGAYTQIGYEKEFKPFTRYTHINESVPDLGSGNYGAVTLIGTRGAWTETPDYGAWTDANAYEKERKPYIRIETMESLPI